MKQRFSLRPMRSLVCFFALASGVVGLSGCASYYYGDRAQASSSVSVRPQGQPRTQLLLANYHAVDVLLQGVQLDPQRSLLVATLVNVDRLEQSSRMGRIFSEQIAGRLVQRGVLVTELKLRENVSLQPYQGELLLSRELKDIARQHNAAMVLVGTYSPAANYTYVSIKLVRTEDSRIIRGYDYALPNDRDVQRLLAVPR